MQAFSLCSLKMKMGFTEDSLYLQLLGVFFVLPAVERYLSKRNTLQDALQKALLTSCVLQPSSAARQDPAPRQPRLQGKTTWHDFLVPPGQGWLLRLHPTTLDIPAVGQPCSPRDLPFPAQQRSGLRLPQQKAMAAPGPALGPKQQLLGQLC